MRVLSRTLGCAVLGIFLPLSVVAQQCVVDEYQLPADIPVPNSEATASTFQEFSWNSFLGLNAPWPGAIADPTDKKAPQWSKWSSTVDMLTCTVTPTPTGCTCPYGNCQKSGARYYPAACRQIPDYEKYRVLDQVGKVDDSFEEADTRGVSNDPVIDRFGNFLRFEILVSPATYKNVVSEQLYDQAHLLESTDDINMWCGSADYTGGDPANPQMGAMVLKAAWMDVEEPPASTSLDLSRYHTEDLLVYTPSYRNSSGVESCEIRKMAMVGMHIEHKTLYQPNWIWTTFEHLDNAPSCTEPLPAPNPGHAGANMSCPVSVAQPYNFYGTECNDSAAECAPCNTAPTTNDPGETCVNPVSPDGTAWCVDLPPAPVSGKSRLCRQVPVVDDPFGPVPNPLPADYPQAAVWNHACVTALTEDGPNVWSNYMLISGQWLKGSALPPPPPPPALPSCVNVAEVVATGVHNSGGGGPVDTTVILPSVTVQGGQDRPFLGNTSMESYDRANCAGCHAKAIITNDQEDILSTDFMYWLSLEVGAQSVNFMSYWLEHIDSQCTKPEDQVEAQFILHGAAQNSFVVDQEFDLVVAIGIPSNVPDPELMAHDVDHPTQPWVLNGQVVEFEVDPSCPAGMCEADAVFPPAGDQRWVQFRTVQPVSITAQESEFSGLLNYVFPEGQCPALNNADFKVWASDTSQQQYANFVDGDIQDGMFMMFVGIPALDGTGVSFLVLLLLLSGVYLLPRLRA